MARRRQAAAVRIRAAVLHLKRGRHHVHNDDEEGDELKIHGIENLSTEQINAELQRGAKFVVFQYCISILVMSFKRSSGIYFVPAGTGTAGKSAGFCGLSLLLGWWGIPWGPIWTIGTVFKNLSGGVDVTGNVLSALNAAAPIPQAPGAQRA